MRSQVKTNSALPPSGIECKRKNPLTDNWLHFYYVGTLICQQATRRWPGDDIRYFDNADTFEWPMSRFA
ncbi:MAG TPA: hypothetical protein VLL82_15565 [Mycobacterium sp.]|nr:hypothetical protein [Mycobacterium sp.]